MKCQHGSTLTDAHERTTVAGDVTFYVWISYELSRTMYLNKPRLYAAQDGRLFMYAHVCQLQSS